MQQRVLMVLRAAIAITLAVFLSSRGAVSALSLDPSATESLLVPEAPLVRLGIHHVNMTMLREGESLTEKACEDCKDRGNTGCKTGNCDAASSDEDAHTCWCSDVYEKPGGYNGFEGCPKDYEDCPAGEQGDDEGESDVDKAEDELEEVLEEKEQADKELEEAQKELDEAKASGDEEAIKEAEEKVKGCEKKCAGCDKKAKACAGKCSAAEKEAAEKAEDCEPAGSEEGAPPPSGPTGKVTGHFTQARLNLRCRVRASCVSLPTNSRVLHRCTDGVEEELETGVCVELRMLGQEKRHNPGLSIRADGQLGR